MTNRRLACLAGMLCLTFTAVEASAARLRIETVQAGFPGSGPTEGRTTGHWYRPGEWVPVLVRIANEEGDLFDGVLEVVATDRDGDEVVARQPAAVRGTRQFILYVPGGKPDKEGFDLTRVRRPPFSVRVHDAAGNLVRVAYGEAKEAVHAAPAEPPSALPPEATVILDVSPVPVNQLALLVEDERLGRDVVVLRASPATLPDHYCGLMMADYIVWDGGDPGSFDLAQREAMIEWVRRGGRLLIGVSRNWEPLRKSAFGALLPAALNGVETGSEFPELAESLLNSQGSFTPSPGRSAGVVFCRIGIDDLTPGATSVVPRRPGGQDRIFVCRRPCGQGSVVLVAAELRELLPIGGEQSRFLRQALDLPMQAVRREEQISSGYSLDLLRRVTALIGFPLTSRLYLLFAFCFVVAYIALATGGLWAWLKRIRRTQLAWPAFAVAALLAGAASLGAVQGIRGLGMRVQEVSIVDLRAESPEAVAMSFLGLKTASHSRLDLCVPQDWTAPRDAVESRALLLPLRPDSRDIFEQRYATPLQYEVVARLGELHEVPFRATVKEFEAHWRGTLPGTVTGRLFHASDRSGELTDASWVQNNLPDDLRGCFLLVRAAGRLDIRVYPIGELPAGGRLSIEEAIRRHLAERPAGAGPAGSLAQVPPLQADLRSWTPPTLATMQRRWARALGVRDGEDDYRWGRDDEQRVRVDTTMVQTALLMLTTYGEGLLSIPGWTMTVELTGGGRRLDRSRDIDERQALFVGFGDRPGPARLCARRPGGLGRWRPVHPSAAQVMYRVLMPVGGRSAASG